MKKYLLIISCFLVSHAVFAQALISGVVKDQATNEPISNVSVLLNGTFNGTSTNENGEFTLQIPDYSMDNSFTFQLIGYKTKSISMGDFMRSDIVFLDIDEQKVNEVLVRPMEASALVKLAAEKIPQNYYSMPVAQEVFYRQSLITNNHLSSIEEGHFNILNTFQRTRMAKDVKVLKSRGYVNMDEYKSLGKIVAKNIITDSIDIDASAKAIIGFNPDYEALITDKEGVFGKNADKYYDFKYAGMAIKNGIVMHLVSFDQKPDVKKTLYKGVMAIDTASKAVVEFEASLSPNGIEFQKLLDLKYRMLAKLAGYKIQIFGLKFAVSYKFYDGFWIVDNGGFYLDGSISKKDSGPYIGNLAYEFKVIRNYDKSDFYGVTTEYALIPSNIEPFKETYFWGETNTIPLKTKLMLLLQEKFTE